jgi:hypothetical protein
MDGWWTPLIVVAAVLAVAWGWTMVYRPLLQVRRLVRDLADFVPSGTRPVQSGGLARQPIRRGSGD